MTRAKAIQEIRSRSRGIVTVSLAKRIAEAFDVDLFSLNVIMHREEGANWQECSETWRAGDSVGIYHLALALCEKKGLGVPPTSPYMGAGKSAEYYSLKCASMLEAALPSDAV